MPNTNERLQIASASRRDEFYTQLTDIEREIRHYREHFVGKTVFCNCDDPRVSNFFHYFSHNFEKLRLKRLITTCYKSQSADLFTTNDSDRAVYLVYDGGRDGDRAPDPSEVGVKNLRGDGDFRSKECLDLLKSSDIVVTNPPFSLFSEFLPLLVAHKKKFIIIGPQNAITYKAIFPLIKDNKVWLGYGFNRNCAHFINPHYEDFATDADHREGMIRVSGVTWYTNIDISKRHEPLILYKTYKGNESDYPKYDNFDAIDVSKTKDIPLDYDGPMGVPITFMDKFNPDQFEILGNLGSYAPDGYSLSSKIFINGKKVFKRILIRLR